MCHTTTMAMFRTFIIIFVFIVSANGMTIGIDALMQCSKYHFEERVLEKLIQLEFKMKKNENMIEKWTSDLKSGLDKIENLKEIIESFMDVQKTEFDKTKENILHKVETVAENLENQSKHQMTLYDRRIETRLNEITGSEKDRNASIQMMRSELWSSFESVINGYRTNISEVLTKQTQLEKDVGKQLSQPVVAFSAYLSTTHSGGNIVKFDGVWSNKGGAYDPNTGVFIAPKPGLYNFVVVGLSLSGTSLYTHLWHNKTPTAGIYPSGSGHNTGTVDVYLELAKNDEVYVRTKAPSAGSIHSNSNKYSTFSGCFIG